MGDTSKYGTGNWYITEVERTHPELHPSKVILNKNCDDYFAEFDSRVELDNFANTLGFKYSLVDAFNNSYCGLIKKYIINIDIEDTDSTELNKEAQKVKLTVGGYTKLYSFINDGQVVYMFKDNQSD